MAATYMNFLSGATTDNPLLIGATTINGTALSSMPAISAPDYCWLVLDPDGANGAPEIVQVTAHTASATSATIVRAQQSTTARAHPVGTVFRVAPTKSDLDELPFRKMTTRGDLLVATAANTAGRLAVGTANYVLKSDGTDPSWGLISASSLASNSVSTAKIVDANVTAAKMAADSVETAAIKDANVTTAKIADSNVTTAKIADDAVTSAKYSPTICRLSKVGTLTTSAADVTGYTEDADASGFYSSGATVTVPAGEDGMYTVCAEAIPNASNAGSLTVSLFIGSSSRGSSITQVVWSGYLAAADTVKAQAFVGNAGDTAKNQTIKLTLVRTA